MDRIEIPAETLAAFGGDELRARVFFEKYALRDREGRTIETTPDQMWLRVAAQIAGVEPTPELRALWTTRFRQLLDDFRFIPGGRIMHAAGQDAVGRKAVPINCFVIPIRDDSLPAIYETCKEMALTYSRGGGVGVDLSPLRPKNAVVHNAARVSTGAVSFMETFSLVTGTIGMEGRRGALMLTIRDDHPDVLDFVRIKRDLTSVRYANISVLLSDAFMEAVKADGPWTLRFHNDDADVHVERTIRAHELWDELVSGARDWAEPGCLFIDTVRRRGTTEYGSMRVLTCNPCAEEFLDPYNNCCLGSLNLLRFVRAPFAPLRATDNVDWAALRSAVFDAVRFLDDVQTYAGPLFPLPAQREASERTRRIGLGVTGLGDMLIALGLRYDSEDGIALVDALMRFIKHRAYLASVALAREKGAFPTFAAEQHLAQEFFSDFPSSLREAIRTYGLRNAALMTVPPVGSGAALAGVTSGIEPVFALAYLRRSESLSQDTFWVLHPLAVRYWAEHVSAPIPAQGPVFANDARAALPSYFVTAHEIDPMMRVRMQAAVGRHVDNAVSSTINLPRGTSAEEIGKLFFSAWEHGLKGVTAYVEGSREGILLTSEDAGRSGSTVTGALAESVSRLAADVLPDAPAGNGQQTPDERILAVVAALAERLRQAPAPLQLQLTGEVPALKPRPPIMPGYTIVQQGPAEKLNVIVNEDNGEPFELIVQAGKTGDDLSAVTQPMARLASLLLRLQRLVPQEERLAMVIEQLRGTKGSRSNGFGPNKVLSEADGIAQALEFYLKQRHPADTAPENAPISTAAQHADTVAGSLPPVAGDSSANFCPRCHNMTLVTTEGCAKCATCGFREC